MEATRGVGLLEVNGAFPENTPVTSNADIEQFLQHSY
jgi:hypothetical protein